MDIVEIVGWALAALAVGVAVYFKMTGAKVEIDNSFREFYERQEVAREAVKAAEQLWNSGQIPEAEDGKKHHLFYWAASYIREYFPDLSDEQMEMTIEAAVYWLKQGVRQVAEG